MKTVALFAFLIVQTSICFSQNKTTSGIKLDLFTENSLFKSQPNFGGYVHGRYAPSTVPFKSGKMVFAYEMDPGGDGKLVGKCAIKLNGHFFILTLMSHSGSDSRFEGEGYDILLSLKEGLGGREDTGTLTVSNAQSKSTYKVHGEAIDGD